MQRWSTFRRATFILKSNYMLCFPQFQLELYKIFRTFTCEYSLISACVHGWEIENLCFHLWIVFFLFTLIFFSSRKKHQTLFCLLLHTCTSCSCHTHATTAINWLWCISEAVFVLVCFAFAFALFPMSWKLWFSNALHLRSYQIILMK